MGDPPQDRIDSYGFERSKDFDYETYNEFLSQYLSVLTRRAQKWDALLMESKDTVKRTLKLKRYIRKGVPQRHRGMIWMSVSGAKLLRDQNPDLYRALLEGPKRDDLVETITLDIPRTFPDNIYFKVSSDDSKIHSLFNVLLAFAHHNPLIGYCQGLNFIAGIMLLVTESEDTTFWLLQVLVQNILPDYYTKEMTGLLTDIGVLEELIKAKVPQVHHHMLECGVSWAMFVSKWFICLFAEVLPIETVLRIWDCLFYEGSKILMRVAVTLVMRNQDKIMATRNFLEITDVFKAMPCGSQVTNCHTFMQAIFREPGSFPRALITKFRTQCREKVEKQQLQQKQQHEHQRQQQELQRQQREQQLEELRQQKEEIALKQESDDREREIEHEEQNSTNQKEAQDIDQQEHDQKDELGSDNQYEPSHSQHAEQ